MNRRYFVSVRHYFDRLNGNSYFTLRVLDNVTGEARTQPKTYGCGFATYIITVARLVDRPVDSSEVWLDEATVTRQRDLHRADS